MLKKIFTALWKSLAARVCVSIYKAVISVLVIVCLFFACPMITQEPLDRFAHILIGEIGKAKEMFLAWF